MKTAKLALLAAMIGAIGLAAAPVAARPPHKVKICKTHILHHRHVQRCTWVVRR